MNSECGMRNAEWKDGKAEVGIEKNAEEISKGHRV